MTKFKSDYESLVKHDIKNNDINEGLQVIILAQTKKIENLEKTVTELTEKHRLAVAAGSILQRLTGWTDETPLLEKFNKSLRTLTMLSAAFAGVFTLYSMFTGTYQVGKIVKDIISKIDMKLIREKLLKTSQEENINLAISRISHVLAEDITNKHLSPEQIVERLKIIEKQATLDAEILSKELDKLGSTPILVSTEKSKEKNSDDDIDLN